MSDYKKNANSDMEPFKIQIPRETLDDLNRRLETIIWPDTVENAGWDYGTNLDYMQDLKEYWQHRYDWRKQETELNKFNHFKSQINEMNIHFIYEQGKGPNPKPIILTHGWPDSFYRYIKLIPMLTDPERYGGNSEDSFDVIVPSIPGFGFSSLPDKPGMTSMKIAKLWNCLMKDVLGYKEFIAAGGDLGSEISQNIAIYDPDSVMGTPFNRYWFLFIECMATRPK